MLLDGESVGVDDSAAPAHATALGDAVEPTVVSAGVIDTDGVGELLVVTLVELTGGSAGFTIARICAS